MGVKRIDSVGKSLEDDVETLNKLYVLDGRGVRLTGVRVILRKFAPVTFSNLQKTDRDENVALLRKACYRVLLNIRNVLLEVFCEFFD